MVIGFKIQILSNFASRKKETDVETNKQIGYTVYIFIVKFFQLTEFINKKN